MQKPQDAHHSPRTWDERPPGRTAGEAPGQADGSEMTETAWSISPTTTDGSWEGAAGGNPENSQVRGDWATRSPKTGKRAEEGKERTEARLSKEAVHSDQRLRQSREPPPSDARNTTLPWDGGDSDHPPHTEGPGERMRPEVSRSGGDTYPRASLICGR